MSLRRSVFNFLEREPPVTSAVKLVHRALVLLILVNIAGAVLDTVPDIHAACAGLLDRIEDFSLLVFAVEYGLRLWAAPKSALTTNRPSWKVRLDWIGSPAGLIDLASILPFVADEVLDIDLRFVVFMRLLRFFKIARYSPGFHSLIEAVRSERHALVACLVILSSIILLSSGMLYVLEHSIQADKFGSIPEAMWWAVATVTTVGYGDVVPVTVAGRIVGAITMVAGLVMLALPAGIVATSFANTIARRNFVVTAAAVARMPIFAGLEVSAVLDLLPSIATLTFVSGEYILRRGERVAALYLIAEGEVEVQLGRRHIVLRAGDTFGGDAKATRKSLRAVTRARVLVLDMLAARWLLNTYPHIAERVTEPA